MNTNTDGVSAMSAELGEPEKQTDWYAGMTEKHYDIAISRAVAAERERCARLCDWLPVGTGLQGKTFGEAIRGTGMGGDLAKGFKA